MSAEQPKLYTELAGWWQLVSPTKDYADEAAFFRELFRAENARTILELGSGGGNIAWFLKRDFTLTLTDISGAMLAESREQNPKLEHIEGDMRALRLGRTFDGVVVIAPDWVAETFQPRTTHEGEDAGERGVRYMEWIWDADPNDTKVNYEFILALKEGDELRTVVDRQVVGVFPHATWLRLLEDVGFEAKIIEDPSTAGERSEVFLGH